MPILFGDARTRFSLYEEDHDSYGLRDCGNRRTVGSCRCSRSSRHNLALTQAAESNRGLEPRACGVGREQPRGLERTVPTGEVMFRPVLVPARRRSRVVCRGLRWQGSVQSGRRRSRQAVTGCGHDGLIQAGALRLDQAKGDGQEVTNSVDRQAQALRCFVHPGDSRDVRDSDRSVLHLRLSSREPVEAKGRRRSAVETRSVEEEVAYVDRDSTGIRWSAQRNIWIEWLRRSIRDYPA